MVVVDDEGDILTSVSSPERLVMGALEVSEILANEYPGRVYRVEV